MRGLRLSRLFQRRNVLLTLISLAVIGLVLPASGGALAATSPGTSLTTGNYETCAIAAGHASCWGPGSDGELGDGSTASSGTPVPVDTSGVLAGKTLTQISAADGYACALDTAGAAYCWGTNEHGQLGFGVLGYSDVPVPVSTKGALAGKRVVQITAGQLAACALDSAGRAYCWGYNGNGELGDGGTANSDVPVAVKTSGALAGKKLTQLSGGSDYTCALDTAGAAFCWGTDNFGQLGDASGASSNVPVAVDASGVLAGKKLTGISASESGQSTCALDASGSAYCWGMNINGQLGDGSTSNSPIPVAVDTSGALAGKTLTQISAGGAETCALDTTGAPFCWGDNFYGELGDNGTSNSPVPVAVDTSGALAGKTLTQIGAGGDFYACAMSTSGAVYCWGYESFDGGQLGDNGTGTSLVPVAAGPSAPTGVSTASGNRTARVSWKAPVMPAALTGYTAIANPGEQICLTTTTSCTITGLTNDTTYSVTVVAHTATTNSAASAPVSVTPGSRVVFTSTPQVTTAFGARFRFTVRAAGGSPAITVRGTLPPGVTFTRHAGGTAVLAGTPDRTAVGVYRLTFTATSKAGKATQAFSLAITRAPELAKLPAVVTLKANQNVNVPVKATGYPVPELIGSGQLPPEVFLDDHGNGTGAITGQVDPHTAGSYRFTVIAASTSGYTTRTITVIVVQPPDITSVGSATAPIGLTFSLHVTATGVPAPKITESGRLPAGVTFHPATATLSGIPRSGTTGTYAITFTATNAAGKVTQHFVLTVT
jgi:alpha-tubulin suppressor-like RCC1 family protein